MVDQNLRLTEEALNWDPAEVTVPSVPAIPPGADPMSVMLAAIAPEIATAVTKGVAEALAREERFSANVNGARTSYQTTDGAAQQQIQGAGELAEPSGAGSTNAAASPAGQAGQLGQMMGMPMQMAQQAAQIPMQLAGMAASIPQGIMQGVQSAMQQVGQMTGGTGEKTDPELEQSAEEAKDAEPVNETPEKSQPSNSDGAAGPSTAERAPATGPQPTPSPEVPQQPHKPAPTRPATSGPESVL